MLRPRPDLLVAASVPVLLAAGMLPWQRDVVCTQGGCGSVTASAWSGSPVWAVVLLAGLAVAGAWVLVLPTRGRVPIAAAALTGVAGVVAAGLVAASLDALVSNRAGFFHVRLPVTEAFPVIAVHPGSGLVVGLAGFLLQAAGGWAAVRRRTGVAPLLPALGARRDAPRHATRPAGGWEAAAFGQGPPPPRHRRQ